MILVSSLKCLFFLPRVSCHSLSNVKNQSPVLQSSSVVSCGSWRGEQLIKKNNPEMLEVIYKTCYFLYSSVKCLLCWELVLCFYKTLPLGNVMMFRCFWSSIQWMAPDGGNFWFLKVCFLCWMSPVCVRPRSAALFQGQLPNLLVTESVRIRGVMLPWGSVTGQNAHLCNWMKSRLEENWHAMACLDFNRQSSLDQTSSFECTCFSTPHVY